jgi:hypothetical protein
MSDGVIRADSAGLQALASELRHGVSGLAEAGRAAPPAPNAGASSARVAATLAAILDETAGVVAGVENTAAKIDASDGSYGEVDNRSATEFGLTGR